MGHLSSPRCCHLHAIRYSVSCPSGVQWFSSGGRIRKQSENPIIRLLKRFYLVVSSRVLRNKWLILTVAMAAMIAPIPVYRTNGSEWTPLLDEGEYFTVVDCSHNYIAI